MTTSAHFVDKHRSAVFVMLLVVMFAIAVGHLYVIADLTTVYLGLPGWLWAQLAIVTVLFLLAWLVTDIISPAGRR